MMIAVVVGVVVVCVVDPAAAAAAVIVVGIYRCVCSPSGRPDRKAQKKGAGAGRASGVDVCLHRGE